MVAAAEACPGLRHRVDQPTIIATDHAMMMLKVATHHMRMVIIIISWSISSHTAHSLLGMAPAICFLLMIRRNQKQALSVVMQAVLAAVLAVRPHACLLAPSAV
jgi:hypothetical protein